MTSTLSNVGNSSRIRYALRVVTLIALARMIPLVAPVNAQQKPCQGLQKIQESLATTSPHPGSKLSQLLTKIAKFLGDHPSSADDCASYSTVIGQLVSGRQRGGRRLDADKPLDVGQAESQLRQAQQDAAIAAKLKQARQQSSDPDIQRVLEAAILDSESYYNARDLQIQRLQELLK